jgi:inosine/xanthosine triphosphatase
MKKKVIVASKKPVKIEAVKIGFEKMLPEIGFDFVGVSVKSNVSDQPLSDRETLRGAMNRCENARERNVEGEYWVGVEGGIEMRDNEMTAFAWIVIKSKNQKGKARTATFFLPPKVTELIRQGVELGEANDIIFGRKNSKQKSGAVGILTGDIIDRTKLYTDGVVLALIPFKEIFTD